MENGEFPKNFYAEKLAPPSLAFGGGELFRMLAHIILSLPCVEHRGKIDAAFNPQKATIVILAALFVSFAHAEDFKTTKGKEYKDATIIRVEGDGIMLRTKTGISKVYFAELPKDVQERFHWTPPKAPREPFYSRWAAATEDPAVLAKIIAAGTSIIAAVALVVGHIRSRRQPAKRARRASRRKAVHRARS